MKKQNQVQDLPVSVYEEIRERVEWTPSIWSKEGAF